MQLLKLSTAATCRIGPCLDSSGVEYTGLVISDLTLTKNGTSAAMAAAATLAHIENGIYSLVFTTGNTDTLGRLTVDCNKATYQIPPRHFSVLSAATFDDWVTNGTMTTRTVIRGTVGATSPSTTSFTPSALDVAGIALNQLVGRVIIFDKDTTTTTLRGQATVITASSIATLPLLTYNTLTNSPVSGDLFSIV